jgi:hypothetical protein
MSLIATLRTPRVEIMGEKVALFATAGTALIGYGIAYKMKWNPWLTIGSLFFIGHATHQVLGIRTAFNKPSEEDINNIK